MRYPAGVEQELEDSRPDRPGGLIGAVDNVLRLLRLFEDHEMIRVNQVARDMGLSRSTVHRMLATLGHHQFVEQDEYSRAYKPGPALVDIGFDWARVKLVPGLSGSDAGNFAGRPPSISDSAFKPPEDAAMTMMSRLTTPDTSVSRKSLPWYA